jgi:hypothetical protein
MQQTTDTTHYHITAANYYVIYTIQDNSPSGDVQSLRILIKIYVFVEVGVKKIPLQSSPFMLFLIFYQVCS